MRSCGSAAPGMNGIGVENALRAFSTPSLACACGSVARRLHREDEDAERLTCSHKTGTASAFPSLKAATRCLPLDGAARYKRLPLDGAARYKVPPPRRSNPLQAPPPRRSSLLQAPPPRRGSPLPAPPPL